MRLQLRGQLGFERQKIIPVFVFVPELMKETHQGIPVRVRRSMGGWTLILRAQAFVGITRTKWIFVEPTYILVHSRNIVVLTMFSEDLGGIEPHSFEFFISLDGASSQAVPIQERAAVPNPFLLNQPYE
jgi:hypothetical protein